MLQNFKRGFLFYLKKNVFKSHDQTDSKFFYNFYFSKNKTNTLICIKTLRNHFFFTLKNIFFLNVAK